MPTTPWISLALCTPDDVLAEARMLNIIASAEATNLRQIIANKIGLAKEQIRGKLMVYLPELFVSTAGTYGYTGSYASWISYMGYSYNQLDTILDRLLNPQELKETAVAYTLRALVFEAMFSANAVLVENGQQLKDLRAIIDKQCTERMADAVKLLKIDLNQDGIVNDGERVRARKTIWPV